ncbi:hypothetical protein DFJ63DRAFT_339512 [Scheffersomyces coipomensis]|uniref:uncharacterized protein n=1 Tax=Scheffersomyces coipomensis TaxID=1788519 RepID=UPI00315D2295
MTSLDKFSKSSITVVEIMVDEISLDDNTLAAAQKVVKDEELPKYQPRNDGVVNDYDEKVEYQCHPVQLKLNLDIKETPMWLKLLESDDSEDKVQIYNSDADDDKEDGINFILAFFMAILLTVVLVKNCYEAEPIYDKSSDESIYCLHRDFKTLAEFEDFILVENLDKESYHTIKHSH